MVYDKELAPVGTCEDCGAKIYEGDISLYRDGFRLCSACVENMSGKDMLEFLGIEMTEASDENEE